MRMKGGREEGREGGIREILKKKIEMELELELFGIGDGFEKERGRGRDGMEWLSRFFFFSGMALTGIDVELD